MRKKLHERQKEKPYKRPLNEALYSRHGSPQFTATWVSAFVETVRGSGGTATVISVEEQLRGRFLQIRKAPSDLHTMAAYKSLREAVEKLNKYQILDYTDTATRIFNTLRQQKIRIGTQDLRIAAIALANNATLVTRNQIDFGQIPALTIEDWTK